MTTQNKENPQSPVSIRLIIKQITATPLISEKNNRESEYQFLPFHNFHVGNKKKAKEIVKNEHAIIQSSRSNLSLVA